MPIALSAPPIETILNLTTVSFPYHKTSFPRAIIHIDGDSFFASCEQSRNPSLTGKAVVTGQDRGIASSMSLEAKKLGITRAMPIHHIKKHFPQVIIIPSDYETYALLSARFMDIVRRFTPDVEEYGIDECFADITGMRKTYRTSYENICKRIQIDLERELNCTFSIGLAPTKTLAKIASKWKKSEMRGGLTAISATDSATYLKKLPIGDVWNIGPQTTAFLEKHGIRRAYDFAARDEAWVRNTMSINFYGTWNELRSQSKQAINTEKKQNTHSIQRTRTFAPPCSDKEYLLARLKENIEVACMRARRYKSEAKDVSFFLKTQTHHYSAMRIRISRPSNFSHEIYSAIEPLFEKIYKPTILYRATGVTLSNLSVVKERQLDLFDEHLYIERMGKVYSSVDTISCKYGRQSIHVGAQYLNIKGRSKTSSEKERKKVIANNRSRKLGYPLLLGDFTLE